MRWLQKIIHVKLLQIYMHCQSFMKILKKRNFCCGCKGKCWEYVESSLWTNWVWFGAILNPCPPFFRGEEVSENVINSDYFVGYEFKKCLINVQQAILCYLLDKKWYKFLTGDVSNSCLLWVEYSCWDILKDSLIRLFGIINNFYLSLQKH